MGALFGGRLPHPPTYVAGGFTATPRTERIRRFASLLDELVTFIERAWIPDVETVASAYPDYLGIGVGPRNLIAYGAFDLDATGTSKLFARGRIVAGAPPVQPIDLAAITEAVSYSWYADGASPLAPAAGQTVPQYPKTGAYSWLKAPRYQGQPYEAGPLARMWVNGEYTSGISVMDRHRARALEALKIAKAMKGWLSGLAPGGPVYAEYSPPSAGQGYGLTEASRGALGHWVALADGVLSHYQVVTPTCWNASPRDEANLPGPLEQALVGTPVGSIEEPVEVLRVVHSFDPCLACAVHAMRPKPGVRVRRVG